MINVKCNACGGESQFEEATAEQEQPCPLCQEMLKVTPTKSAAELSEEEQMAQYEEALKETDWGHPSGMDFRDDGCGGGASLTTGKLL